MTIYLLLISMPCDCSMEIHQESSQALPRKDFYGHIPQNFQQIMILIYKNSFITPSKQLPFFYILMIKSFGINTVYVAHAA